MGGSFGLKTVFREEHYQVVQLRVITEEWFVLLFLLVYEILNVYIEAGGSDALGALCRLLTLLKQQRQQGE